MATQRAEDLVFVHINIRLLSRKSQKYHEGESKMWDVGGDSFDSLDDLGILEIANLSLDEPELEAIVFSNEDEELEEEDNIEVGLVWLYRNAFVFLVTFFRCRVYSIGS